MRSMQLFEPGRPLQLVRGERRRPAPGQVLLRVGACGVCRTDLHIVDGELPRLGHPVIPGHEIVGTVVEAGPDAGPVAAPAGAQVVPAEAAAVFRIGTRVGVPWLGWTCGSCAYCRSGRENLCDAARFTGYQIDGGYADYALADSRYCFALPAGYSDAAAAPLLCAGLIGYRALRMAGDARRLGIYGFGAAAHIVAQVARYQGREFHAFTRPGDLAAQDFARSLGAASAGDSGQPPPVPLDAAILFAPVGALVPLALRAVAKGGVVVCAGIHMSEIPAFPYELLWGERKLVSVANLTRQDGAEFLALAPEIPIRTVVETFPLEKANEALSALRQGRVSGAAVLVTREG